MVNLDAPHQLYADGCDPDFTLVLLDCKGKRLAQLQVVRYILAVWSPVLRGAMDCTEGPELQLQVDGPAEVHAWRVAACLIHPLDPTHTGASPSSLLHVSSLQALLVLADKYNMQGLLPFCKDMLLSRTYVCGLDGSKAIDSSKELDAFQWIKIADDIPGFDNVVSKCIQAIVLSTTSCAGRAPRTMEASRYTGHERLLATMACLRPQTCAKLAANMASCLATLSEAQTAQGYRMSPSRDSEWGWNYMWSN